MVKKHTTSSTASSGASASKSSILKSSFAPSSFQLRLFASVIQSFESQQLRIHDISTGRLRCQYAAKPGQRITCLDWGHSKSLANGTASKRNTASNDVLLAYGTSTSEICLFAPAEGRIVGELSGLHERGISDFRFSQANPRHGFSLGEDGKLIQWDIDGRNAIRTVALPDAGISTLAPITLSTSILCASSTPYLLFPESHNDIQPQSFDAMKNPIRSLYRSNPSTGSEELFLAVDGDRYINIYDTGKQRLSRTLIASSEIKAIHLDAGDVELASEREQQVLAVVNKAGTVELFPKPFIIPSANNNDLKSSRKGLTQKSTAQLKLVDSTGRSAPIFAASVQGPEVVMASVSGGVEIGFQKVRWQDEGSGELLFTGTKEVAKSKAVASLTVSNGVKDTGRPHVDESNVVVSNGLGVAGSQDAAIEIESSDEGDDEEGGSESEADAADAHDASDASDEDMADAPPMTSDTVGPADAVASTDSAVVETEQAEPSFADRLAALHPKTIDIPSASAVQPLVNSGHRALPTGMSLSTVLTQSLRTNDAPLLEACLHTADPSIVRNTLTRLDPSLASILIQKLAERIVSRPGRYGGLQLWVQHLCVAHGASISQNPAARGSLKTLYRALDQRASGLPSLLLLKGKLQMVEGQLRFRREIAAQRAEAGIGGGAGGRPINVMVEGDGDNWDSSDADEAIGTTNGTKPSKRVRRKALDDLIARSDDSGDEEDMPSHALTNGVAGNDSSDNEEHSSSSSDDDDGMQKLLQRPNGALLDDEAELESGSADDSDEADSDGESDEDEDEDEDDEEMDSFINDDEISVDDDDVLLDDAPSVDDGTQVEKEVEKPKTKRRKT